MAALVVSILTTATLVYQTHIIQQQYSASIWPYLNVATTINSNGESIAIVNDGLGPLLVRSAQLYVDGRAIPSWNDLAHVLIKDPLTRLAVKGSSSTGTAADVDASTTVRPGDSLTIFALTLPKGVPMQLLLRHPLTMDFCYCSLNGSCWKLHATPGVMSGNFPHPAASCPIGATINSYVRIRP